MSSVDTLVGEATLARAASANVLGWTFPLNVGDRTIVVYRFEIDYALCNDDTKSLFRLRHGALAIVTACSRPRRSSTQWADDQPRDVGAPPDVQYTPIAQSARIQGIVVVRATVGSDGAVQEVTALRGVPFVTETALKHAKSRRFATTTGVKMVLVYEFLLEGWAGCDSSTTLVKALLHPWFLRISAPSPCVQY